MGLKKLFVIAVLAGTMSVLGCGDDGGGNGGNGATGGDGGTGGSAATGGSGGTGGGNTSCGTEPAEELCCFGRCVDNPPASDALFDECVDAVNLCLIDGTPAGCQTVADQKCIGG